MEIEFFIFLVVAFKHVKHNFTRGLTMTLEINIGKITGNIGLKSFKLTFG